MARKKAEETADIPLATPVEDDGKRQPVHRVRFHTHGGTLSASLWPRIIQGNGGDKTVYSVILQRSYFNEETKEWVWTNGLRDLDIPVALLALEQAYLWCASQRQPKDETPAF